MKAKLPYDEYIGVLTPELFGPESFFCKPVLVLVQSTLKSRLTGIFITEMLRFTNAFTTGS